MKRVASKPKWLIWGSKLELCELEDAGKFSSSGCLLLQDIQKCWPRMAKVNPASQGYLGLSFKLPRPSELQNHVLAQGRASRSSRRSLRPLAAEFSRPREKTPHVAFWQGSPSPSPVHKTEPPAMALDLGALHLESQRGVTLASSFPQVKALTTKPWKSNLSINLPEPTAQSSQDNSGGFLHAVQVQALVSDPADRSGQNRLGRA